MLATWVKTLYTLYIIVIIFIKDYFYYSLKWIVNRFIIIILLFYILNYILGIVKPAQVLARIVHLYRGLDKRASSPSSNKHSNKFISLQASSLGRSGGGVGKRRRVCNYVSASNSLIASRQLSCQISASQRESETHANVNKHWITRESTCQW